MSKDGVRRDIKIRDIYRDADNGETIYTLICGRNEWTIHRYDDFGGKRNPFAGVYLYTEDDTFSPLATGRELYDLIPELSGDIVYSSDIKSFTKLGRKSVKASELRRRTINASVDRVARDFMRFLRELETDLQNNESEYITLGANEISPSVEGGHTYEIIPYYNGYQGDDWDDVLMIDTEPSGEIVAYENRDNNYVVAQGYSFRDIRFNCYNWLKETLIDIYDNIPDYED